MKIEKLFCTVTSPETVSKINELIDALNTQNKEVPWEPEMFREYYYIDDRGEVSTSDWADDRIDRHRRDFLGIYQTEALALEAKRIIKLVHGV